MLIKYECMCGTTHSYHGFKFLKSWDDFETLQDKALKAFAKWWRFNLEITHGREIGTIETFGFPYTSSSDFAAIWNSNCEAIYKWDSHFQFRCLAISEDGFIIAHFCQYDDDKNELDEDMNIIIGRL